MLIFAASYHHLSFSPSHLLTFLILGIIPARYASTRFPGKPLVEIQGKTMIQRVYEQAVQSRSLQEVIVATDDARILAHVQQFGGKAVMTLDTHPSGTDRCAEVARLFPEAAVVVNIQGDEPFIQPEQIDLLVETLTNHPDCPIATLAKAITDPLVLDNPNVVKVVFSTLYNNAIYFSRHAIPFARGIDATQRLNHFSYYKHIGLYAFQSEFLKKIANLPPTPLERAESLEQLRWLENGLKIAVGITPFETIGIDTPEDLHYIK